MAWFASSRHINKVRVSILDQVNSLLDLLCSRPYACFLISKQFLFSFKAFTVSLVFSNPYNSEQTISGDVHINCVLIEFGINIIFFSLAIRRVDFKICHILQRRTSRLRLHHFSVNSYSNYFSSLFLCIYIVFCSFPLLFDKECEVVNFVKLKEVCLGIKTWYIK